MSNFQVNQWQQRGRLFLWKNWHQPGEPWNLTADGEGYDALAELLDLMQRAPKPCKKIFILTKPEHPPDSSEERPFFAARQLTIKYLKDVVQDDHWRLREAGPSLVLAVGRSRLAELQATITDLQNGTSTGNCAVGGEDNPLRIW